MSSLLKMATKVQDNKVIIDKDDYKSMIELLIELDNDEENQEWYQKELNKL